MSFLFESNPSQGYQIAKLHQQEMLKEFSRQAHLRDAVEALLQEQKAERQFQFKYQVRHWLHRLAPRMARVML